MLVRSLARRVRVPPDAIWPLLADTARMNEAFGLPKHQILETPRPDGSVEFRGRTKVGPFRLEWLDLPVNWVAGQWMEHRRRFLKGPLERLDAILTLAPDGAGCKVGYRLEAAPSGLLGRLLVGSVLKTGLENAAKAIAQAEARVLGQRETIFDYTPPRLPAAARQRAARAVQRIEASGHGHGLAERLADKVMTGQEVDLLRLRPLALARDWQVRARQAVELCLQATREGLLSLTWSLLCPRCRGAKISVTALDELPSGAHCSTCNIDYGRDFARNVELAFAPAAAIRPLESGEYCLFSPRSVPHVMLQVRLEPGERRTLPCALPPAPTGRARWSRGRSRTSPSGRACPPSPPATTAWPSRKRPRPGR